MRTRGLLRTALKVQRSAEGIQDGVMEQERTLRRNLTIARRNDVREYVGKILAGPGPWISSGLRRCAGALSCGLLLESHFALGLLFVSGAGVRSSELIVSRRISGLHLHIRLERRNRITKSSGRIQ